MTRRALAAVPLRFVLVATEALLHRGQRRAARFHHARVTRHALALDTFERQMSIVIEADFAVYRRGRRRKYGLQVLAIVLVTARAQVGARQRLPLSAIRKRVTAGATQTGGLAASATGEAGKVKLMRKTRRRVISAGGRQCRAKQEQ
jgi:hypothetical protein